MFSDEIKYQIDFIKNSKEFVFLEYWSYDIFKTNLDNLINTVKKHNLKKIHIVVYNELFKTDDRIDELIKSIDTLNIEYYISCSTSTPFPKSFNPLVNIYFWKNNNIRNNIKWDLNNNEVPLFVKNIYENIPKKTIKGILSIRKETIRRKFLNAHVDVANFEGIYRYASYPDSYSVELSNEKINTFPTTYKLIDEYKKSFVSFVVESEPHKNMSNKNLKDMGFDMNADIVNYSYKLNKYNMNFLTEKTLIAFLTKTMPIVLGGKNYVKELKEMGFYVWNTDFGFESADSFHTRSNNKIIKFIDCINFYNSMTHEDVEKMYNSNIDKINNNYNIVYNILFNQ
jgi:hypothetical protein